jgi:hypothetical protein
MAELAGAELQAVVVEAYRAGYRQAVADALQVVAAARVGRAPRLRRALRALAALLPA